MKATRLLPLLAAVLLGAAPAASARAPATSDQASLDWLLLRLAKDREEDKKGGGVVDEVLAFARGDTPLEGDAGWKRMIEIVYSPTDKVLRKEAAAQSVVDRFKLEDERKVIEQKALVAVKVQVCRDTLKGMLGTNSAVLGCIFKIQRALLPAEWVGWAPSDSLAKRKGFFNELSKRLK